MRESPYYPLRFTPVYQTRVWGGRLIAETLGRALPDGPIGDAWEVSAHPQGISIVANGALAGQSLPALTAADPQGIMGSALAARFGSHFPLLVKYIDAAAALSVQVHPDDTYAAAHAGEGGKAEMWHVLHAEPGAKVIAGLREGVTRSAFKAALAEGRITELLQYVPMSTGDSILIPAGCVHTLLGGLLMLEVQQSSDTTYRLYDWGRPGLDGAPRALQIADGLAAIHWDETALYRRFADPGDYRPPERATLAECKDFRVERIEARAPLAVDLEGRFRVVNVIAGSGMLAWTGGREALNVGDSLLVPAALEAFTLEPEGKLTVVVSSVP